MWNIIFLPSTTSPPKDLRPKPSPLVEQFLGGTQGLPPFFHGLEWVTRGGRRCCCCYIWGSFVGAAGDWAAPTNDRVLLPAIYRGGSITSHPYKWPTYKIAAASSFSSGHSLQPVKKKVERPWAPPKNCSIKGEILVSNPLVERLLKVTKCYSKLFF